MTTGELAAILKAHSQWLRSEPGGHRAYLRGADLRGADLMGAYLRGADLRGADLRGADLMGAYLRGADLSRADLRGAYLRGADLTGADLRGTDLRGADLMGADLTGAYLRGAYLRGAVGEELKLVDAGFRTVMQVGPIGSRGDYLTLWLTDKGPRLSTGCFFGTVDQFREAVKSAHSDTAHGREYAAVLPFLEAHAEIWTPASTKVETPA